MYIVDILKLGVIVFKEKGDFILVGCDEELVFMINILSCCVVYNVIFIGQGGVGCFVLILGL